MTYDFECQNCGHVEEVFYKSIQKDLKPPEKCPKCNKNNMKRIYSKPDVLFNCMGFYATDVLGKGTTRMIEKKNAKTGSDQVKVETK